MEYKKSAGARLTYDDNMDMIILEHLESETGEPQKNGPIYPMEIMKVLNGRTGNGCILKKYLTK